jgi:lysophospholipase L1-like esterase
MGTSTTDRPIRRRRSRWGLAAILVLVTPVLFECLLQVISYAVWSSEQREVATKADSPVVLCVGDSFTWGLGASGDAFSYPAQLQVELAARGSDWQVVNGGWPGRSSEELAVQLSKQLDQHAPRHLVVLIGTNDSWKTARRVTLEQCLDGEKDRSFPLVWRTGQLLALVSARADPPADVPQLGRSDTSNNRQSAASRSREARSDVVSDVAVFLDAPFVGVWYGADYMLTVEPEGRFRLNLTDGPGSGPIPPQGGIMNWGMLDDSILLTTPDGARQALLDWSMDKGMLRLEGDVLPGRRLLLSKERGALHRAWRSVRAGDHKEAGVLFESVIEDGNISAEQALSVNEGLVQTHVALGSPELAAPYLAFLRARYEETHERSCAEALVHALAAIGESDESVAIASATVRDHPRSQRCWDILAGATRRQSHRAVLIDTLDDVLARLPQEDSMHLKLVLTLSSALVDDNQPGRSLAVLLDAAATGRQADMAMQSLFDDSAIYTPELLDECLANLSLPTPIEARLRAIYADAMESRVPRGGRGILGANLLVVVALCEQRGIGVTLLGYPHEVLGHDAIIGKAAASSGADLLQIRSEFDGQLETRKREELFVSDGHCNDRGYGIVARLVADKLLARRRVDS